MHEQIEIKKLGIDSIEDQVLVYIDAFSVNEEYNEVLAMWKKKHYSNPLGHSYVFGAYMGDVLVGVNAFIPLIYELKGEKINVVQSANSGVLKQYQGKKIWSKIINYSINYFNENTNLGIVAILGFPDVNTSYSGFIKMGWKEIYDEKNMIMVNNAKSFSCISNNKIKSLISRLMFVQKVKIKIFSSKKYSFRKINIDEINDFDTPFPPDKFHLKHSSDFLNWKSDCNNMECYKIEKNNELVGYYFISVSKYRDVSFVRIDDIWIYNNNEKKKAICSCVNNIIKDNKKTAYIRIWAKKDTDMYKLYKKMGFINAKHRNPFIVLSLSEKDEIRNKLLNSLLWETTFMDLD